MSNVIYESDPYEVRFSSKPGIFHYVHKDGWPLQPLVPEDAWVLRRLIDESVEARRPFYTYWRPDACQEAEEGMNETRKCSSDSCQNQILSIMSNPFCDACSAAYHRGYIAGALDAAQGLVTPEAMRELRERYLPSQESERT